MRFSSGFFATARLDEPVRRDPRCLSAMSNDRLRPLRLCLVDMNNAHVNQAMRCLRGIVGTFHHISRKHTHRYCGEFDFRYNGRFMTDSERRDAAVQSAEGRRLYYKSANAKNNLIDSRPT